jgi:hypothetical protein
MNHQSPTMASQATAELPKLPPHVGEESHGPSQSPVKLYDADQMRAFYELGRASRAQSEWQPIETAPKTGRTLLLGYFNALGKWRTLRGQWFTDAVIQEEWTNSDVHEAGWFETSVECDDEDSGCWPTDPTHWQPLPTPPATTGETK